MIWLTMLVFGESGDCPCMTGLWASACTWTLYVYNPAVCSLPGPHRHSGAQCITCSYKASSGLLYPLERGFIYVHKPPVHIRFDEISFVNFARGTTTTRSFDFEIETKQATQYTFSSIER